MPSLAATQRYVRDEAVAVLSRRHGLILCKPDGELLVVEPVDAAWLSGALGRAVVPVLGRELLRGATRAQAKLLGHLLDEGVLREAVRPPRPSAAGRPCRHLVVGMSGAVQTLHAPALLLPLLFRFCERLDVVLTDAATQFVAPQALRYLGVGVWTDAHAPVGSVTVPHVHLAQSAELVLIAPASASTVQRLATGACSDLLSLVVAATQAPVVVAPSMNAAMWRKPAVARNVAQLREDGVLVVEPGAGLEVAAGAAAVPELGGMGVSPDNVLTVLGSVLALGRASVR